LPPQAAEAHVNGAQVPRHPGFEVAKNRFFRTGGNLSYRARLPACPDPAGMHFGFARLVNAAHRRINPLVQSKPPAMAAATRQLLDDYFERELDGLNELLGRDVMSLWFGRNG
jgi:hypothetical protein